MRLWSTPNGHKPKGRAVKANVSQVLRRIEGSLEKVVHRSLPGSVSKAFHEEELGSVSGIGLKWISAI